MPYTIEWESKGVYKRFFGICSWEEYVRSSEEVLGNLRFDEIHYAINDLRDVEGYSAISPDQADYSAAMTRGASMSNPRLKIAFVTADRRIRMLVRAAMMITPYEVEIFSSVAEARAWCELGD
jgi:hypothetical protein